MDFSEWVNAEYIKWCGRQRRTITEFAEYLDVKQPSLSKWMGKGGKRPDAESIEKLAEKLGPEVYDVLGLLRPGAVPVPLETLPLDFRERLSAALEEIKAAATDRKISDPDSPEAVKLASEIFAKHGFRSIKAE